MEIQSAVAINFIFSKDNDEEQVLHSKSDNIKIMINGEADEAREEPFKSLLNRHQNNLGKLIKSSNFVFNYAHLFYYKCYKINANRSGSFIGSPDWILKSKNKSCQ